MENKVFTKYVDIIVAVLLVIGGLNWGLLGFFGFDLIAFIFGEMAFLSRLVYAIVGICAIYQAVQVKAIYRRWHCAGLPFATKGAMN